MLFADANANAVAYLVLRHLYDGDVIEWPIADDHPHAAVLRGLEEQGLVARWDRVWPLHDRYRLTERGIKAIEAVYRPSGAEQFFEGLRARNLPAPERRRFLESQGLDPLLWPLLHDPTTHWTTFGQVAARYHRYVWEDSFPAPPRRADRRAKPAAAPKVVHHHHHHHHPPLQPPLQTFDLDRDAAEAPGFAPGGATQDYDVS